jgi:hypothetical protein
MMVYGFYYLRTLWGFSIVGILLKGAFGFGTLFLKAFFGTL